MGFREEGGFVGDRDRQTGEPIPEHISAKAIDLVALTDSLIATGEKLENSEFNPVLAATMVAFGLFLYILLKMEMAGFTGILNIISLLK